MFKEKTEMSELPIKTPDLTTFFNQQSLLDKIYTILQYYDDLSEIVFAALEIFKPHYFTVEVESKCPVKSEIFRTIGNKAYSSERYLNALRFYNRALLYAPTGSNAMLLAYSNRSAVLMKVNAYEECLKDIRTCYSMVCLTDGIKKKLNERYKECKNNYNNNSEQNIDSQIFLTKVHSVVPCVSAQVKINKNKEGLHTMAAHDIKVGTIVSVEEAFMSVTNKENTDIACDYCQKYCLNLMPCNGCCCVLYCSDLCKEKSLNEYHQYECTIMSDLKRTCYDADELNELVVRSFLKMKQSCEQWDDLIKESMCLGQNRFTKSSVTDICDGKKCFSLLCTTSRRNILCGRMFNAALLCVNIINKLTAKCPSFFPADESNRKKAIGAMARIMIHLYISSPNIIRNSSYNKEYPLGLIEQEKINNFAWFAFTGHLRHKCDANLVALGLNKKTALLAVKPIKAGRELTISYLGHWYDSIYEDSFTRARSLYTYATVTCTCRVCTENWNRRNLSKSELSAKQKLCYNKWSLIKCTGSLSEREFYDYTCNLLGMLRKVPNTPEHYDVYLLWKRNQNILQVFETGNSTIDDEYTSLNRSS